MKEFLIGCLIALIIIVGLAAFEGWIVSLLWNWLAPIFWTNAPILSVWQAFGILFLLNLIGRVFFGSKNS